MVKKMRDAENVFTADAIEFIYENTTDNSALRSLVCHSLAKIRHYQPVIGNALGETLRNDIEEAIAVAEKLEDRLFKGDPLVCATLTSLKPRCSWHVHEEGVTCSATKASKRSVVSDEVSLL